MNDTASHTTTIKLITNTRTTTLSAKLLKKADDMSNKANLTENKTFTKFQQNLLAKDDSTDECAEGLAELCEKVQLEWWAYMILAVFIFLVLLLLNFIVKKINDARMEERCARLYKKNSTCTQVQTTLIKGDYDSKKKVEITKSLTSALTGVSLIFTKSDNDRISTNTSTSTALKIVDCGEAFRNARSVIDSIYEESEFSHIIHCDTNTLDVVQNNDNVKDGNDIKETKQSSGDASANCVAAVITTKEKEFSDAVDSDGNIKNRAYLEFEAIRKSFEVLGGKRQTFLKNQFKTINTSTNKNYDTTMVHSKNTCPQNSNNDVVMKHTEDIKNKVEIYDEDPEKDLGEETKVTNIENKTILNGTCSKTKVIAVKDVKSKVFLTDTRINIEISKAGKEFKNNENNKCENT